LISRIRHPRPDDAGIVDEHADRAERRLRALDRLSDRGRIGHVHLHRDGATALPSYLLLEALQFGGLPRRKHDRGAMRRQHPRELPAQPLRGTGDENDFFTDVEYVRHGELRKHSARAY
jgi:hypothetical protein